MKITKITAFLLLLFFLLSTTLFASQEQVAVDAHDLSKKHSKQIADEYLQHFAKLDDYWKDTKTGSFMLFNFPNNQPGAYVYEVIGNGRPVGHIIISASDNLAPFISLSTTSISEMLATAQKDLLSNDVKININEANYIYGGNFFLAIEISTEKGNKITYDLTRREVISELVITDIPIHNKSIATQQWESVYKNAREGSLFLTNSLNDFTTQSTKTLLVRSYDQEKLPSNMASSGCGPTSGANILNYWDENGYDNLQVNTDRQNGLNLMQKLYGDMGTTIAGTTASGWQNGLRKHANTDSGYRFSTSNIPWSEDFGWASIVYDLYMVPEISNNRPSSMLFILGGSPYNYHFVTCIGYDTASRTYRVSNG